MTHALPAHLYKDPAISVENDDYRENGCGGCLQNMRDKKGKACNAGQAVYPYGSRECNFYVRKGKCQKL